MKKSKYLSGVVAVALLTPLSLLAADKTTRSVTIADPVTVGTTHLKAGSYKVEWEGSGPEVQVSFLQNGKTVATVPAKLQARDSEIRQDDVITDRSNAHSETLKEIDFSRQKEALTFSQSRM